MSTYQAPLADMQFVLNELAGIDAVGKLPGFEEATPDVVAAILEEAGKFATNVLDPINWTGDQEGARWNADGSVTTPAGFKAAFTPVTCDETAGTATVCAILKLFVSPENSAMWPDALNHK